MKKIYIETILRTYQMLSMYHFGMWYRVLKRNFFEQLVSQLSLLTPLLRRPYIHKKKKFRPPVGQRVNTHSIFWEFCRKPCQHATRGCDKRWMTCIHAGVSWSPREHAPVPPDKRHCHQWMSSLFCGFLPNPFIHDLFCWSSRHKFVKTDFIHCLWCLSGTLSVRPGAGW